MKIIEVKLRVPVDDMVKPSDIEAVVKNQAYFLMGAYELAGGHVEWHKISVRASE